MKQGENKFETFRNRPLETPIINISSVLGWIKITDFDTYKGKLFSFKYNILI